MYNCELLHIAARVACLSSIKCLLTLGAQAIWSNAIGQPSLRKVSIFHVKLVVNRMRRLKPIKMRRRRSKRWICGLSNIQRWERRKKLSFITFERNSDWVSTNTWTARDSRSGGYFARSKVSPSKNPDIKPLVVSFSLGVGIYFSPLAALWCQVSSRDSIFYRLILPLKLSAIPSERLLLKMLQMLVSWLKLISTLVPIRLFQTQKDYSHFTMLKLLKFSQLWHDHQVGSWAKEWNSFRNLYFSRTQISFADFSTVKCCWNRENSICSRIHSKLNSIRCSLSWSRVKLRLVFKIILWTLSLIDSYKALFW